MDNHCEVIDFIRQDKTITGVVAHDKISGKQFDISGFTVVNAAGPYLPGLNSKIKGLHLRKETTGFSKGVHLVTRQIEKNMHLPSAVVKKPRG